MIALALSHPRYAPSRPGRVGIVIDSAPKLPVGFDPKALHAAWASLTTDERDKAFAWAKSYAAPWPGGIAPTASCLSVSQKLAIFCQLGAKIAKETLDTVDNPYPAEAFKSIENTVKPYIPTQVIGDRMVDLTNWYVSTNYLGDSQVYYNRMFEATRDLMAAGWFLVASELGEAVSGDASNQKKAVYVDGKAQPITLNLSTFKVNTGAGSGGSGGSGGKGVAQQDLSTAEKAEGYDNLKTVVQVVIVGGVAYYIWKNWKK